MTRKLTPAAPVSLAEFDAMFEAVKNWGRWGPDDERGTMNYLTPDKVAAAALVKSGRTVSMANPDQQGRRARQSQSGSPPHVADARHPDHDVGPVLRHVLPRHGQPRRLPPMSMR
ncbi:MAG: hypothetical protein R3D33_18205 [Hyphomicrobiaceae bacterium]